MRLAPSAAEVRRHFVDPIGSKVNEATADKPPALQDVLGSAALAAHSGILIEAKAGR